MSRIKKIIVFTTDTIGRGGKERQLFILTKALLNKKFEVCIITKHIARENYLSEYGLNKDRVQLYDGITWIKKYQSFKRIIASIDIDILMSWDIQTSVFALLLYKKHTFRFINASIQHGIRLFKLNHLFRSLICRFSPFVIANSKAGLAANKLKESKRRLILYNGIENKFHNSLTWRKVEEKRKQLITGYSLNPGPVFITVANMIPFKDYLTVLKAFEKFKKLKSFYYFIIGDGPMREEIEFIIKAYGLEENIILTGRINNVSDYLFIADIMIHSSRGEGICNAILEGMYAGLPIIATHVGGIPETVFPASSMLFPYKNDKALYKCLIKAPEVFKDFDKNSEAYLKHLSKFSVETMVNRFEEIIKIVTDKGNR
jgi:glycosyltransferase involved in cell wall biosynthesis